MHHCKNEVLAMEINAGHNIIKETKEPHTGSCLKFVQDSNTSGLVLFGCYGCRMRKLHNLKITKSVIHSGRSIISGSSAISVFESVFVLSLFSDQLLPEDEDEGGGEEESQASIQQTTHAHTHFHCQTGGFQ